MSDDGLQFLQVHHDAAVAGEADDPAPAGRVIRADRRGQIIAHRGAARICIEPLARFQVRRLEDRHAGRAISRYDNIAFLQFAEEEFAEYIRIDQPFRCPIFGQDDGVTGRELATARQERGARVLLVANGDGQSCRRRKEGAQIRVNRAMEMIRVTRPITGSRSRRLS